MMPSTDFYLGVGSTLLVLLTVYLCVGGYKELRYGDNEDVCTKCGIRVRPTGGHLCGDCGRDI